MSGRGIRNDGRILWVLSLPELSRVIAEREQVNRRPGEKGLTIHSEPSDARVEINHTLVGNRPIQSEMKEFFFNGPKYIWSEFLQAPLQMTVSKEDYAPQTIVMTTGPYRWAQYINPNYAAEKIFYVITQTAFRVKLERVSRSPGGNPPIGIGANAYARTGVAVVSEPNGAEIYVDEQFDSSTPSKLMLVHGGKTLAAEVLTLLLTPKPLDLPSPLTDKAMILPDDLVTRWERQWKPRWSS